MGVFREYGRMILALKAATAVAAESFAMELVKPTSVDKAGVGSTATISANGSVDFTACTSLSLNDVFSAEYDNYMVVMRAVGSGSEDALVRLRVSGSDASGTNYTNQTLNAYSTTVDGARSTSQTFAQLADLNSTLRSGYVFYVYGPFLAQATAFRSCSIIGTDNSRLYDRASTHSLSTSYSGLSLVMSTTNFTGNIAVYGLRG